MNPNDRLRELIVELEREVALVKSRVPPEGPILWWRGFHTDLDTIDALTRRLRLGARGVFADPSESESEGKDG